MELKKELKKNMGKPAFSLQHEEGERVVSVTKNIDGYTVTMFIDVPSLDEMIKETAVNCGGTDRSIHDMLGDETFKAGMTRFTPEFYGVTHCHKVARLEDILEAVSYLEEQGYISINAKLAVIMGAVADYINEKR